MYIVYTFYTFEVLWYKFKIDSSIKTEKTTDCITELKFNFSRVAKGLIFNFILLLPFFFFFWRTVCSLKEYNVTFFKFFHPCSAWRLWKYALYRKLWHAKTSPDTDYFLYFALDIIFKVLIYKKNYYFKCLNICT